MCGIIHFRLCCYMKASHIRVLVAVSHHRDVNYFHITVQSAACNSLRSWFTNFPFRFIPTFRCSVCKALQTTLLTTATTTTNTHTVFQTYLLIQIALHDPSHELFVLTKQSQCLRHNKTLPPVNLTSKTDMWIRQRKKGKSQRRLSLGTEARK